MITEDQARNIARGFAVGAIWRCASELNEQMGHAKKVLEVSGTYGTVTEDDLDRVLAAIDTIVNELHTQWGTPHD